MTATRREMLAGVAAATMPAPASPPGPLRIMSFNVRVPVDREPARNWEARRPAVAALLDATRPDVIGMQELVRRQAEDIAADLPAYAWFGRSRDGREDGERMGVFYRRDRLRLLDRGDFWFSDTPDVVGSMGWGNIYPRMATWGLFERRDTGARFRVFDTHFPYRDEDALIRLRCADALLARIAALPAREAVVVTGDFNADATDSVHARLTRLLADARVAAAPRVTGPPGTFHGFEGKAARRIDWILTRGVRVHALATLADRYGGLWPSDHFAVIATVD